MAERRAVPWRNSSLRYGWVAITFHWVVAALILFQLGLGIYMIEFVKEGSMEQFRVFQLHKSVGITILLLALLRLLWRLIDPPPELPDTMRGWEKMLAKISHFGLYLLMLLIPFLGWAVVSSSPLGIPTKLYGTIPWPHLPILTDVANKEAVSEFFAEMHEIFAFLLIALLVAHVAGALQHHFIKRDDVLRRMSPVRLKEARE